VGARERERGALAQTLTKLNSQLYLCESKARLQQDLGVVVSEATISRALQLLKLTRKKKMRIVANKFNPLNLVRYALFLQFQQTLNTNTVVWVDETGLNDLDAQRTHARRAHTVAEKGRRVRVPSRAVKPALPAAPRRAAPRATHPHAVALAQRRVEDIPIYRAFLLSFWLFWRAARRARLRGAAGRNSAGRLAEPGTGGLHFLRPRCVLGRRGDTAARCAHALRCNTNRCAPPRAPVCAPHGWHQPCACAAAAARQTGARRRRTAVLKSAQ
jgi:hypothetical protein